MRIRVKICGITRLEDAEAALRLGADYLGFNFYAPSPRAIEVAEAARLRRAIGDRARVVGVFVDHDAADVTRIAAEVGLDLLQFHGDESPLDLEPHAERAIKVFRVAGALPYAELERYPRVWGFLLDTARGAAKPSNAAPTLTTPTAHATLGYERYGGTGQRWDWEAGGALPTGRPLFVAGGVRPDNVAELVARLSPWGIDVSSGVEAAPGRKDPALLERLFEEISHAQTAGAS